MATPGVRRPLPAGYINGLACHPVDRKAFPPRLPGASLPTGMRSALSPESAHGADALPEDAHHISTPPIGSGMFKEEAAVPAPPSSSASTVPTPGVRPPLPPGYINGLACHPVDRKAFSPRLPGASLPGTRSPLPPEHAHGTDDQPEDAHSISTPPLGSGKANEASTIREVPKESPSTVSTTDSDHLASNGSNDVEKETRFVLPRRRATLRRLTTLRPAGRSVPRMKFLMPLHLTQMLTVI